MQTTFETSYYPTVGEILELPVFSTSRLLAGVKGLDHPILGLNLSDNPDYASWISEGELMISTCYSICKDPQAMRDYIPTLAAKGLAGFCIKPTKYLNGKIPDEMIKQADQYGFPLIELPPDIQFSNINSILSEELTRRRTTLLQNTIAVNQMLIRTITEGADLNMIAKMISDLSSGSILIVDSINNLHSLFLRECDGKEFAGFSETQKISIVTKNSQAYELKLGEGSYGYLYIYHPTQNPPLAPELLSQISSTIPLEITREQSVREHGDTLFASFLSHLLSDPITDDHWEQSRANDFKLNLSDNHLIFHLKIDRLKESVNQYRDSFQHTLLVGNIRSTFTKLGIDIRIVRTAEDDLILLNTPEEHLDFQQLIHHLPALLSSFSNEYPDLKLTCGCGRPHFGINGIIQTDTEAKLALKSAISTGQQFLRFDELGLLRLLHSGNPDAESNQFIYELLDPLIKNDLQKHTSLMLTLDYYFEYFGNIKRISEEMFTHYNTISYRIKNIQELTGLDLHNREDHFLLETALYLYKFKNKLAF